MTNEFFVRCDCRKRRFTGGKSRFLQDADGGKGIVNAAAELGGVALGLFPLKIRQTADIKALQKSKKKLNNRV